MLVKGTKSNRPKLVTWLNSLRPGVINFKYEFSTMKVEFLNLEIYLEKGKIKPIH